MAINCDFYKVLQCGWVWWHPTVIPALREAEAGGVWGWEFKTSLDSMTKLQPPANRDWMSEEECPIPELHSKTPSQQNKSQQQQKQTHSVTMLSLSQGLGLHQNQKLPTHVLRKTETTALWDTLTEKAIVESTESELSKNNKEWPSWLQMPRQLHRIGREKKN